MVVAQLVERSLPAPKVRGSNPVIGRFFIHLLTINCIEKTNKVYTIFKNGKCTIFFFKWVTCGQVPEEDDFKQQQMKRILTYFVIVYHAAYTGPIIQKHFALMQSKEA